ncbi:MAG: rhodanese-like domain-containing protein [Bacteriovoracia bacterium]
MTENQNNQDLPFVNFAYYCFVDFSSLDFQSVRKKLLDFCLPHEMRGTILLAPEGINCGVCGSPSVIAKFRKLLEQELSLDLSTAKENRSEEITFRRMHVKVKKEIIPSDSKENVSINPRLNRAPSVEPETLQQWLDSKKEIILLDTRNNYEVACGTFEGALDLKIRHFRKFNQALDRLPEEYKDRTIVTFCTGGIRCEKAAPMMVEKGFKNVYQLEGGILKYFEKCGGKYWNGTCFIFDKREELNPDFSVKR